MDAKELRKGNGEDDNINGNTCDSEADPSPSPSHSELLRAALMLRKHAGTLDDPFSHKLELMLGSFGQQTRVAMIQGAKNNKLTNYFTRE